MTTGNHKPIIFLAFANEPPGALDHLCNLGEDARRLGIILRQDKKPRKYQAEDRDPSVAAFQTELKQVVKMQASAGLAAPPAGPTAGQWGFCWRWSMACVVEECALREF